MKEEDLMFISQNRRWPFGFDIISDYITVYVLPVFFTAIALAVFFSDKESGGKSGISIFTCLLLLVIAYCLARFLKQRMDAGVYFFEISKPNGGMNSVVKAVESLNWQIEKTTDKFLIAHTRMTAFSWGETVTIVLDDHWMLFNSRPNRQPLTLNKRELVNLDKFLNSL